MRGEIFQGPTVHAEHIGGASAWTGGKPSHTYRTHVVPRLGSRKKITKWVAGAGAESTDGRGPKLSAKRDEYELSMLKGEAPGGKRFAVAPMPWDATDALVLVITHPQVWCSELKKPKLGASIWEMLRCIVMLEALDTVRDLREAMDASKSLLIVKSPGRHPAVDPLWDHLLQAALPGIDARVIPHPGPCQLLEISAPCTVATLRMDQPSAVRMRTPLTWLWPRCVSEILQSTLRGTPSVVAPLHVRVMSRKGMRGRAISNIRMVREAVDAQIASRGGAVLQEEGPPVARDASGESWVHKTRAAWQQTVVAIGPPGGGMAAACVWMPAGGTIILTGPRDTQEAAYAVLAHACGHHVLHVNAHGPARTMPYSANDTTYVDAPALGQQLEHAVAHLMGADASAFSSDEEVGGEGEW